MLPLNSQLYITTRPSPVRSYLPEAGQELSARSNGRQMDFEQQLLTMQTSFADLQLFLSLHSFRDEHEKTGAHNERPSEIWKL